ncbi:hypothetical protein NEMIN01_0220 [Nematocida minor]|uniref:uncharacterized protein n=1 Tax=Nematocida minor TaxID=1912983 RepID=UPI00221FD9FD|nr:uncharacterized protein NEMIN01_0116 [Nematocida minor]XP_051332122.1 uncharacterized protein NEMIN01_0220 [Nematocida minor]KAI5188852.1 hypothetical protein NEMIN01_0116 [Nematocida minor]KAI5188956.1 hypothetical protein NEMIN01_0220 [Nematocida minor]
MHIVLDRKACVAIDKGISGKFEQISVRVKDSGLYIQAVDKSRSMVVDHYIDTMLLESCSGESEGITIPYTKFLLAGMDRLSFSKTGSLLKLVWTGSGILLEKNVYILDFVWSEIEYSLGSVLFSLQYTALSLIRRVCGNELEICVEKTKVEIRALSENHIVLTSSLEAPVACKCSFTLLKYHLDRLPKYTYTAATFNIDKQGLVILSLEALGVITTITIATEVLFFE